MLDSNYVIYKPGLRRAERTMAPAPQRILNNSRSLVDSRFFHFFNSFLSCIENKYKIVYSFMVLCSEGNVLEVINTDNIVIYDRVCFPKRKKEIFV
jgi:hypothetical protein